VEAADQQERGGAELALHRFVVVVNTIAVNVSDVNDDAAVDGVRRTVHATFSHLLGNWHVGISAPAEPGRWDLHLRGAFGHHVAHFLAEPRQVADAVERCLRAFLSRVVTPLSPCGRKRSPRLEKRALERDFRIKR
jgi:hypothetical protein